MALPLAFAACSSEDVLVETNELQGQYNVEKVNAVFGTDAAESRLATGWMENLEAGKDMLGLAWLGDGENVEINGKAFQNHPLYTQANGNLKPETSIYVGEYFSYYPYDTKTVSVANVNFSVANQPLTTVYNDIAKNSIWISPKWTTVTSTGVDADGEAGIEKPTAIYPRLLTNRVRLSLEFENNNIAQGNTSINYVQVGYLNNNETNSVVSFKYNPTVQIAEGETIAQDFWAHKTINDVQKAGDATTGYIKLQSEPYEVLADAEGVGFFYNALPMIERPSATTDVFVMLNTTYGNIYIQKPFNTVAYTRGEEGYDVYPDAVAPFGECKSFVYKLNKLGKFEIKVNFLTALMNGMCVQDDAHLNKLLKYYAQYKKGTIYDEYSNANGGIVLKLDATDGVFELSKENIELLREINAEKDLILLDWCTKARSTNKLVVTGGEEVPELSHVFVNPTEVYLSEEEWTWNDDEAKEMGNVTSITNEGTLNVAAAFISVEEEQFMLNNDATMNLTAVSVFQIDATNNGVINIAKGAEYRVDASTLVNTVTSVTGVRTGVWGVINNEGKLVLVENTEAEIHNHGYIKHSEGAYTLISHNQTNGATIKNALSETNKLGIIEVDSEREDEQIAVYQGNSCNKGIIVKTWIPTEDNKYVKPENRVYNYLIVKNDIKFDDFTVIPQFVEFEGQKLNYSLEDNGWIYSLSSKPNFQCVIVDADSDVTITKGSSMVLECAYVKGDIYNAGTWKMGPWTKTGSTYNVSTRVNDYQVYFGGAATDYTNVGTSVNY